MTVPREEEVAKPSQSARINRVDIVRAVQTPLGFFVLAVLVVEAIFGLLAAASDAPERGYIIGGMFFLLLLLIGIVTFLAYHRPEALAGTRPVDPVQLPAVEPHSAGLERIAKPRVFCGATPEYLSLGFDGDVEAIEQGLSVQPVKANLSGSSDLRSRLTREQFDIVHLLGLVEAATGDFLVGSQHERLTADALATLAIVTRARLVVLACCDSLALGARLARDTNVIAGLGEIEISRAVAWAETFYLMLGRGESLTSAFELATDSTDCSMVLLLRSNVAFAAPQAT